MNEKLHISKYAKRGSDGAENDGTTSIKFNEETSQEMVDMLLVKWGWEIVETLTLAKNLYIIRPFRQSMSLPSDMRKHRVVNHCEWMLLEHIGPR